MVIIDKNLIYFGVFISYLALSWHDLQAKTIHFNKPANKELWIYFHQNLQIEDLVKTKKLYKEQKSWHWQWKLGLMKKCELKYHSACEKVFYKNLFDPAQVVRNKAANTIGTLYDNFRNLKLTKKILLRAYTTKPKTRNGKLDASKKSILFVLLQMNQFKLNPFLLKLANKYPHTKDYMNRFKQSLDISH